VASIVTVLTVENVEAVTVEVLEVLEGLGFSPWRYWSTGWPGVFTVE
jgi:hypothetical protein